MKSWRQTDQARKLVRLFSRHSASTLSGGDEAGIQLICREFLYSRNEYRKLARQRDFARAYMAIQSIRQNIDSILADFPGDSPAQLQLALGRLKEYRRNGDLDEAHVARDIMRATLLAGWKQQERDDFEQRAELLLTFQDYFFSYTNKGAEQVNQLFKPAFFKSTLDLLPEYESRRNLLAGQIAQFFAGEGLIGYFDLNKVEVGDAVSEEVLAAADQAFTFVQLVAKPVLVRTSGHENWCFREYRAYHGEELQPSNELARQRVRKCLFLIGEWWTEPQPKPPALIAMPAVMVDEYRDWFQRMLDLEVKVLDWTHAFYLRRDIEEVARKIRDFRDEALDWVVSV